MTPQATITLSYPGTSIPDQECTWQDFVEANDDIDMVAAVEAQIAECNYAEIGGGAMLLIWVFA
jgi:hypothetical protein